MEDRIRTLELMIDDLNKSNMNLYKRISELEQRFKNHINDIDTAHRI